MRNNAEATHQGIGYQCMQVLEILAIIATRVNRRHQQGFGIHEHSMYYTAAAIESMDVLCSKLVVVNSVYAADEARVCSKQVLHEEDASCAVMSEALMSCQCWTGR